MDASARIQEFLSVTGAQRSSTAKFYLNACNWRLDEAVSMYLDDPKEVDEEPTPRTATLPGPAYSKPRVAGFGDILSGEGAEPKQDYYTGGSKSGLSVADKQQKGPELAQQLLDAAREHIGKHPHGDDDDDDDEDEGDDLGRGVHGKRGKELKFSGPGYRLDGSQQAPPVSTATGPSAGSSEIGPLDVKITLWRDGFSVDDGPLRSYEDPVNKQFLEMLQRGFVPPELTRERRRVNVALEQRTEDAYEAPKRVFRAFEGSGSTLQAKSPSSVTTATAVPSKLGAPRPLDESKPKTRVQVRMHDGTRLTAHFNLDHTVGDLRAFVSRAEPSTGPFELQTTFPVKTLTNDGETLQAAGLANAVVAQRKL